MFFNCFRFFGNILQFSLILISIMRNYEQMFYADRDGLLDQWIGPAYERMYVDTFGTPGFGVWWSTRQHWFSADFRAHVDGLVSQGPASILVEALRPRGDEQLTRTSTYGEAS